VESWRADAMKMNDLSCVGSWSGSSAIADEVRACWAHEIRSYHMPGHKGGQGAHALAAELIGAAALRADLSELRGFDYLHSATPPHCSARAKVFFW
jgi:arginine/lysine/ornithine decarboxylase